MEGVEVIGMCSWRVQLISIKVFEKHLKLVFFVYIITSRPNVLKKKKKVIQLKGSLLFVLQTILIVKVYEL